MATGTTTSITSNVSYSDKQEMTKDDDTLIIRGATVTLLAPAGELFTNEGDDTAQVEDSRIVTNEPNLGFKMGDGNDTLSLKNSVISVPVYMGNGNDYVRIEGTIQTRTILNKTISFSDSSDSIGTGNETLELIGMLENNGSIILGSSGIKTLRFNGGALLGTGSISNISNLDVSLSGGTTGSNLTLSGNQTNITLNGNLFGTTDNKSISVSNNTTTLTVGNNIRSNVKYSLSNASLVQTEGGTLEISEHSGYAFNANAGSVVTIHNIVTNDGGAISGNGSIWTITNGDFSNSNKQTTLILKNSAKLTGAQLSFSGNQGHGALLLENSTFNISGFRANNNRTIISATATKWAAFSAIATVSASARGGAIYQNNGNTTLANATISGNIARSYVYALAYSTHSNATTPGRSYASSFACGGAIYQNNGTLSLASASFSQNMVYATATTEGEIGYSSAHAYGGALFLANTYADMENMSFSGNQAQAHSSKGEYTRLGTINYATAHGGAIYQEGGQITLRQATISGNIAYAVDSFADIAAYVSSITAYASACGGAFFLTNTIANLENVSFSGNKASAQYIRPGTNYADDKRDLSLSAYGGALYLKKATLNYAVTSGKKVTNTGNKVLATNIAGGWLYAADASTVNITVESNATLAIGDSNKYTDRTTKDDSIAGDSTGLITKSGTGLLQINSDISGYAGKWSINEGTIHLRRTFLTINLDNWTIGTNGTLRLSEEKDIINMRMHKKVGLIDLGGGSDEINTNGYDLTDGELLVSTIIFNGTGRINTRITNRNTTKGNSITLNGVVLDSDFTGNQYDDFITIGKESTIRGKLDLGSGNNTITATAKATFTNTLKTGTGSDTLTFSDVVFEDVVDLGDGNNILKSTGTAQVSRTFSTGSGNDTLSFARATFDDSVNLGDGNNSLTATGTANLQKLIGGNGNDNITLNGDSSISGEISLGAGINSIHVNKKLTVSDGIQIAKDGQTTVYVYLGTTLANNKLSVYADADAERDTITLNWSGQTGLDKVRILVSSNPSSFKNNQYEFAVELYNQSKSFTLDLQHGYFIQFQAQDDNGWKQRLLDDTIAPDQVTGLNFNGRSLTWDEAHDNLGGNGVKQYHVEISDNAAFTNLLVSTTTSETQYSLTSTSDAMLYFRVSAEDYNGNVSVWSETASGFYDNTPPSRPSGGSSEVNGYSVTLSWSEAIDTGSSVVEYEYRVARDDSFGQILKNGTTEIRTVSIDNLNYGTYYWQIRAWDAAGNVSDWSLSKNFATVDAVAPDIPGNLDYGINNETSLSVIWDGVSDDSLGSGLKGYEIQLAYDAAFNNLAKTVSVTTAEALIENLSNGVYYMRVCAEDNAGNKSGWTDTVSFSIDKNIIAPTVSNIQADITTPTQGNVIVTATFADDVEVVESLYRIGETGEWKPYVNGVTVTDNAIVYFKAIDNSGNESEIATYMVSNIDRTPPAKPTASANITSQTLDNVVVTAVFSEDSVEKEYSLDGYNWSAYPGGVTFENNGYVYFRGIDAAGNISDVTYYAVNNIVPKYVHNVVLSGGTTRIVSSGQIYDNTTINSYASFHISSGGVAIGTIVNSGGTMRCFGVASDTTVKSGGKMSCFGGEIVGAMISSGGSFALDSLGTARDTVIQGMAFVNGLTDNTTVNVGGNFVVMKGNATNVVENGGVVVIYTGTTVSFASNTFYDLSLATSATVHYHTTATRTTIASGGILSCCGGEANKTTVLSGGTLFANAGKLNDTTLRLGGRFICYNYADANNTVISSGGVMHVSNGGNVNNTTVLSGGSTYVSSGAKANSVTVDSGGRFHIYSGGTASDITASIGGRFGFCVAPNTYVNGACNGSSFEMKNSLISDYTIYSDCIVEVCGGGTANNTTVNSNGKLWVYPGGILNGITVNSGGNLEVYSSSIITGRISFENGAIVSISPDCALDFDLTQTVSGEEALVNNLSAIKGSPLYTLTVSSSQANGMYMLAEGASTFNNTITVQNVSGKKLGTLSVGELVDINGTNYSLKLNKGVLSLSIGADNVAPTVSNIQADITSITNQNVTVTATFKDNVELEKSLYSIGDKLNWKNYVNGVTISENTTVYFKATDAAGNESEVASYVVGNIDKVAPSAPSGLKALKDEQTVMLIWNASTDSLSGVREYIVNYTNGNQSFTVKTNNTNYMLNNLASGSWSWTVQAIDNVGNVSTTTSGKAFTVQSAGPEKPYVARGDCDGNGVSDVMFVWIGNTYAHGYWMNGKNDWWSANATWISPEWDNLGSYDMSGDGKADAVMFGNVIVNDARGAYIGYYQDGNDMDGWVTIGFLDNSENVAWQNKVGNLTGGKANSIVWYAPELYALGVWTDGTETWVGISERFGGDVWNLAGCGDFSGDGKESVLMSYNENQYYIVDLDGTVTSMGASAWYNCAVRAIGDFSGDGKEDIVLFDENTGSMYMLLDGNADNYQVIGQLDPTDWFVAGCGDYNADGTDDLLVRQYSTGMLGYYSNGNQSNWNVMGYGVGMEWTVIA